MKVFFDRLFSPAIAMLSGVISWATLSELAITLIIAFVSGFLGYCGKKLAQWLLDKRKEERRVFVSKARETEHQSGK